MGKASRRKKDAQGKTKVAPAPYVARPFAGLPGEPDWVAAYEILPAATATLHLDPAAVPEGSPETVTLATVLPMAWPALRRDTGEILVATQAGSASGDPSRDMAQALLTALATEPGAPVAQLPRTTAETPRLQDLVDTSAPFELTVHEVFDFWVEGQEVSGEAAASLERANESVVPSTPVAGTPSTYWCRIGERTYIRHVLADDEETATTALARLHAKGEAHLDEERRLLGAFRAGGLIVPVWEVAPDSEPAEHEGAVADFAARYATAAASTDELTAEERRARSGLISRQVTLR